MDTNNIIQEILRESEEKVALLKNKFTLLGNSSNSSLRELIYFTYDNLGFNRKDLPQINKEDLDELILHFQNVAKVKKIKIPLFKLKPAQGELNYSKIQNKINANSKQWLSRIYICSQDYRLIDGHHDYANGLEINPEQEVMVYRIVLPFGNLIKRIKMMNISKKKDILDNLLESYGIKKDKI